MRLFRRSAKQDSRRCDGDLSGKLKWEGSTHGSITTVGRTSALLFARSSNVHVVCGLLDDLQSSG